MEHVYLIKQHDLIVEHIDLNVEHVDLNVEHVEVDFYPQPSLLIKEIGYPIWNYYPQHSPMASTWNGVFPFKFVIPGYNDDDYIVTLPVFRDNKWLRLFLWGLLRLYICIEKKNLHEIKLFLSVNIRNVSKAMDNNSRNNAKLAHGLILWYCCNMNIQLLSFKYDVCHKEFEPKSATASWNSTFVMFTFISPATPRGQLRMRVASFYELVKILLVYRVKLSTWFCTVSIWC